MIVPANSAEAKRTCTTCAKNKAQRFCAAYIDDVSGELAAIREARAICEGSAWERAFWRADDPLEPGPIETPKATIHKDPWDKINKAYE